MKRISAPKHWMLDKLTGVFAPRPSAGPHKLRECIPMLLLLRNRLKYALTYAEAKVIMNSRSIKVDSKIRTDMTYPCGFMDVISIEKTDEHFRLLHDVKGRFMLHRITEKESAYKLCRVKALSMGVGKIPYIVTHDGRTIRFPHPDIKKNDTVKLNFATGEIEKVVKFDNGASVFVTGGNNQGRAGVLQHVEHHPGSYEIAHVRDTRGHTFATRLSNIFVIGAGKQPLISLPRGNGIKLSLIEERDRKDHRHAADDEEDEQ